MKYYIILIEPSYPLLETIKVLKDMCGMGLHDGKKMCQSVPCVVKEVKSIEEAEWCIKYLTENGAKSKYQYYEY